MATSDSTQQKPKLSDDDLKQLEGNIYQAGMMFVSILQWAKETDAEVNLTAVEALCEKGGFITDRCLSLIGAPGIHGSFESWADMKRPAAEAAAEAQVTQ